jgi:CheY-like chemotaxis protein
MRSLRIVIADDNRDAANGLAKLLNSIGHSTYVAFDGCSAIQLAELVRPEVVLLDLGLPDMTGYSVCRRIREFLQEDLLGAIAITGWSSEQARIQSFDAGFDRHLVKPAKLDSLLDVLEDLTAESP